MDPGLAQMRASTCFSCHQIESASAGPAYRSVAMKYKNNAGALEQLSQKVLSGGTGVWGQLPMPPHPQHTADQVRQMISWVLALGDEGSLPVAGAQGVYTAPQKPAEGIRANEGVLILTAAYTDEGRAGAFPRLEGQGSVVLHSRRKKAALYDVNRGMAYVEQVEGEMGLVGHFKNNTHILWKELHLGGIRHAKFRTGCFSQNGGTLELHAGSPDGPLLASVNVPPTGNGAFEEVVAAVSPTETLVDLCVVARCSEPNTVLGLNWVEFLP
jgi:cytochrome c